MEEVRMGQTWARILVRAKLQIFATPVLGGDGRSHDLERRTDEHPGPGGRVTNTVGTIFRKIFVGTRACPI